MIPPAVAARIGKIAGGIAFFISIANDINTTFQEYSACYVPFKDDLGSFILTDDGARSAGVHWYDVHFEKAAKLLDEKFAKKKFVADDWSPDREHDKAVEIAVDFFRNFKAGAKDLPKTKFIECS